MKKKSVWLINKKPGENYYNKPQENNTKSKQPPNKQAHITYNRKKRHLKHHDTKKIHKRTTHKVFITQEAAKAFLLAPLFLLFPLIVTLLREFSIFLIKSSEAFPAKAHAMFLPSPGSFQTDGQAAKLFSKIRLGVMP
jgi:hypothetical protein